MAGSTESTQSWRFGVFEVDLRAGELRKHGVRIALQQKPLQVLTALLSHPGEVVTREELRRALWPDTTFVDFDHSINIAISKLRLALGDPGKNPRFVETLSRYGYRFIAPVQSQSAAAQPRKAMLAVLPFRDLDGGQGQNYFADGLTEEMIAQLGRLDPRRLGVIARTTAMHYKETVLRADEIGRELSVDYILEGSVRRSADRVRITSQLIQISDQTHLWAETYDRKLADVLDIQRSVSHRIARSLAMELLPEQQAALTRQFTRNVAAHEAYLRGRYFWNRRTEGNFARAIEWFELAIREDPGYALAYAGLATAFVTLGLFTGIPPRQARAKTMQAADAALRIDPQLAEAFTALAYGKALFDWDWTGALQAFSQAIESDPSYVTAHHWCGHVLAMLGRFDESQAQMALALELDPRSPVTNAHTGWTLYFARRYEESAERLRLTEELDSEFALASYFAGLTDLQLGRLDDAVRQFERGERLSPGHPPVLSALGRAYAMRGKLAEARAYLDALRAKAAGRYVSPYLPALVHVGLGESDQAMARLEEAYEQGCPWMAFLNVEPLLDPLRSDPRFRGLLRRMGLAPVSPGTC
ncbi:MAG TPA: tetratricopeptide repeat protein [Verrucomicrobiae bacterium]|nr:tetratricopeptide repeat protein [Verrucomicrobiae bacterium]